MEKLILAKSNSLEEINRFLADGWKVKMMKPIAETIAGNGDSRSCEVGDIYVYIVLEK